MRTLFKDSNFKLGLIATIAVIIIVGIASAGYAAYHSRENPVKKADGSVAVKVSSSDKHKSNTTVSEPALSTTTTQAKPVTTTHAKPATTTTTLEPRKAITTHSGKVVVIDPGHQTHADLSREPIGPGSSEKKEKTQGGTRGVNSKTPEYKVALDISLKLKAKLESKGVKVIMTRETNDVNLSNIDRAQIANKAGADLFVRIHADGDASSDRNGISTLYPASNQWTTPIYSNSKSAAGIIQKSVTQTTEHKDNGIVARGDLTGFNWSKVPAVLVETGFMTNPEEDAALNDPSYQDKLAEGICNGILSYLQTKN